MGETDTIEPTVMLSQNQATCVVALPYLDALRQGGCAPAILVSQLMDNSEAFFVSKEILGRERGEGTSELERYSEF